MYVVYVERKKEGPREREKWREQLLLLSQRDARARLVSRPLLVGHFFYFKRIRMRNDDDDDDDDDDEDEKKYICIW